MPGPYYFYLNFSKIHAYDEKTGRKRMMPPSYRDQDHEYYTEIHNAKEGGYGIIVGKARRKGFSFMNANILLAEWSLYPDSENGIGAPSTEPANLDQAQQMPRTPQGWRSMQLRIEGTV